MKQIWNGNSCLEHLHGTKVWNRFMKQNWNSNMLSGTDARNRAGMEIRCLEQMHGTEQERKYVVEQLHRTLIKFLMIRLND